MESLFLKLDNQTFTLKDMLNKYQKPQKENLDDKNERIEYLQNIFSINENRIKCCILSILGYDLHVEQVGHNLEEIVTETTTNIIRKEKNGKIDHIIWNILSNGTSELTNMENAVYKLLREVLSKENEEQEEAWKKYREDMFNGRLRKNNGTVFRFGIDTFLPLFRAFKVYKAKSNEWQLFLDFYFKKYREKENGKYITRELIDNFNYCDVYDKNVFFKVIRFFNNQEAISNFNEDKSYKLFLEKYLGTITNFNYSKRMEYWMFQFNDNWNEHIEYVENMLGELEQSLIQQKKLQTADYIIEEFDDCIQFVKMNQQLIQCDKHAPSREPNMKLTHTGTKWIHQEEVDRLLTLKNQLEPNEFKNALGESYKEGKLFFKEHDYIEKH